LFDEIIPEQPLEDIRDALNKAWVLGDDRFKQSIENQTGRRASPMRRGGDRKSKAYQANREF
jgi:putative transposase